MFLFFTFPSREHSDHEDCLGSITNYQASDKLDKHCVDDLILNIHVHKEGMSHMVLLCFFFIVLFSGF
jgi:hypothetical protein